MKWSEKMNDRSEYINKWKRENRKKIAPKEKKYRKEHEEHYRILRREWDKKHPDKVKEYNSSQKRKDFLKKYRTTEKYKNVQKRFYKKHKQERSKEHKIYYQNNKERLKEYNKKYYEEHREQYAKWRKDNKERLKELSKKYRENPLNKERDKEQKKVYREKNKEKIRNYQNAWSRTTEKGKMNRAKKKAKRRGKKWIRILPNIFPDDMLIDDHHINDIFVVPLPREIHKRNGYGTNIEKHRKTCLKWIELCYGINSISIISDSFS